MVAPTHGDPKKVQTNLGMIAYHVYTVVSAHILAGQKVLKLRNPHGKGEWTGDWGDSSSKWTDVLKQQVGLSSKVDGTFFIPIDSFFHNFTEVAICHYRESSIYSSFSLDKAKMTGIHQFEITVKTPGKYYIQLSKPDQRYDDVTEHSYATMIMVKKSSDNVEYIGGKMHVERDQYFKADLSEGKYILIVSFK